MRFVQAEGHTAPLFTTTTGPQLTVTTTVSLLTQPLALVVVRTYVVVTVGVANGFGQVVQLSPVDGLHEYVPPPVPLRVTPPPEEHMVTSVPAFAFGDSEMLIV